MIRRNSADWEVFLNHLHSITQKSNREVLCSNCWQMLNQKQKLKHLRAFPDHREFLITSK